MTKSNFKNCLAVTLKQEGGWSDNAKDPGGATMKGVTLATYRRRRPNATKQDLRNITQAELEEIYLSDYWLPIKGDTLETGVDLAVFDYGVNSGPQTARNQLLKVVGGTPVQTIKKLCAKRLGIYQTFKTWKTFGKGWARRIAEIEATAVSWALGATASAKPVLQQEAKSASATAKKQATGAVGTATGSSLGSGAVVDNSDQWAGIAVGGVLIVGVLVVIYLVWRAHVNSERAKAYQGVA